MVHLGKEVVRGFEGLQLQDRPRERAHVLGDHDFLRAGFYDDLPAGGSLLLKLNNDVVEFHQTLRRRLPGLAADRQRVSSFPHERHGAALLSLLYSLLGAKNLK